MTYLEGLQLALSLEHCLLSALDDGCLGSVGAVLEVLRGKTYSKINQ